MKNKIKKIIMILLCAVMLLGITSCRGKAQTGENDSGIIEIGIGYQSATAQTWGSLIIKNQKLFEKELEKQFPNKKFKIIWENATSGPPLTNNMIAGKLQFAFMGDLPILVNGEKGQTEKNYDSVFLAFDGKGVDGANQSILIPKDSEIKSIKDLKGKEISVPIGSSSHRMLNLALQQNDMLDDVTIINQDVNVGLTNIEQGKIAAHATWEPFPTLAATKDIGKILLDGCETGYDYLDGVVADRNWVEGNEGYTIAFLKALVNAHNFIKENPEEAAKIFTEESGYSEDVTKVMVENINFESFIHDKDIETISGDLDFAISVGNVKSLKLDEFIDDSYLKKAHEQLEKEYSNKSEQLNTIKAFDYCYIY